jgi:hypothetical protein
MALQDLIDEFKKLPELGGIAGDVATSVFNTVNAFKALDDATVRSVTGLEKQLAINQKLSKVLADLAKPAFALEKRNAALNKSFGISSLGAAKLSQNFVKLAAEINVSNTRMQEYAGNIHKMLPTLNQLNVSNNKQYKGLVNVNNVLTKNLGLSAQQAEEFSFYATQNGKNAQSQLGLVKSISDTLDPEGTLGYVKQITEDVAEAGAELQLQYGKLPGNLEMAALKGRALGISLQQMQTTANKLLNIESSIGDELEYQLLSGHRLVNEVSGKSLTNAYREAAITRNASKQASILNEILENEGDVLETNLFARQQMSQLLGIDEKTLSRSIQKQRLLKSINGGDQLFQLEGQALTKAASDMVKAGEMSAADFEELMKVTDTRTGDEILAEQLEVQEDMRILNEMQTVQLSQLVKISNVRGAMLNKANLKNIGDQMLDLSESQLQTLGEAVTAYRKGQAVKDTATIAGTSYEPTTTLTKENDVIVPPAGYGNTVISRPEGSIALNNNDDVAIVAGTNLGKGNNGGSASDMMQFAAAIVSAIQQQTQALKSNPTFGGGMNNPYYS